MVILISDVSLCFVTHLQMADIYGFMTSMP